MSDFISFSFSQFSKMNMFYVILIADENKKLKQIYDSKGEKLFGTPLFLLFFSPAACGILVIEPELNPGPQQTTLSTSHWTARESHEFHF